MQYQANSKTAKQHNSHWQLKKHQLACYYLRQIICHHAGMDVFLKIGRVAEKEFYFFSSGLVCFHAVLVLTCRQEYQNCLLS